MADERLDDSAGAAALLAMHDGSLNGSAHKRPTRIIRKTRRALGQDSIETIVKKEAASPRKQPKPSPLRSIASPIKSEKLIAQENGLRLRNLLKLPKAHKWVYYEWFYSTLDQSLLLGENDFQAVLKENFPELRSRSLRKAEWCKIRRLMGKPRRCSSAFFAEERVLLAQKRQKIRQIQQRKVTDISDADMKDLPEEIPLPLIIGTEVTALLRNPQDGLHAGVIDAVDSVNNTYRITFDRVGLGTHTVPDYEVLSNQLQDTLPLSSFQQKSRPRYPLCTPPRGQLQLDNDPLLGFASIGPDTLIDQRGFIGGFPVKFLLKITKLSRSLRVKKEKLADLKMMNAKAERLQSYQEPLPVEFQKRYAYHILELEELNRQLDDQLTSVQTFSRELAIEGGLGGIDQSHETKVKCDEEARKMFTERCKDLKYTVSSPDMAALITKLSSILLQLKAMSESDINSFDLRSIQQSLEEIRVATDSTNTSCFRNNVEVHINHMQSCLTHMGNLHAFTSSTSFL